MGRISEVVYTSTKISVEDLQKQYYYQNIIQDDPDVIDEYEEYEINERNLRNEAIRNAFNNYKDKHPKMDTVMAFISGDGGVNLIVETEDKK